MTDIFNVALIGNIGVGKTTLITKLKDELDFLNYTVETHPENIQEWESFGPKKENILQKFYETPKENSFFFQILAATTKAEQFEKFRFSEINIIERTFECQQKIFIPMLKEQCYITDNEEILLDKLLQQFLLQEKYKINLFIWLKCSPETSLERIKKRERKGEENISLVYLQSIHKKHEQWINEIKKKYQNNESKTCCIEFNVDKIINEEEISKLCNDILKEFYKNKAYQDTLVKPSKQLKNNTQLQIVKLSEKAFVPIKGSAISAGFDLFSAYDYIVPTHEKCLVSTDIQINVPKGTYGRIAPRSGLAWKNNIHVGAGVIDPDFRGNVKVLILNLGNEMFKIKAGDRIAQLICEKIENPNIILKKNLNKTIRNNDGFGSTGL